MAFDALKGMMSQMALRKMTERSPQGQAGLKYAQLRNRELAIQIEKMVPLQLKNLEKQLEAFLMPAEQQALELQKAEMLSNIRANEEAYTQALRGAQERETLGLKAGIESELAKQQGGIRAGLESQEVANRMRLLQEEYNRREKLERIKGSFKTKGEGNALQRQRERLWQEYTTGSPLTDLGVAPTAEELAVAQTEFFKSGRLPLGWTSEKKAPIPERYTAGQAEGLSKIVQTWMSANQDKLPDWVYDDFFDWQADDPEGALNAILADPKVVAEMPEEVRSSVEKLRSYYVGNPAQGGGLGLTDTDLQFLKKASGK